MPEFKSIIVFQMMRQALPSLPNSYGFFQSTFVTLELLINERLLIVRFVLMMTSGILVKTQKYQELLLNQSDAVQLHQLEVRLVYSIHVFQLAVKLHQQQQTRQNVYFMMTSLLSMMFHRRNNEDCNGQTVRSA